MSALVSTSICPSCLFSVAARALYQSARQRQPWVAQRLYAGGKRTTPSRMVLSDRVARPPRREADSQDRRPRSSEGPFAGMNQTIAPSFDRRASPYRRESRYGRDDRHGYPSRDSRDSRSRDRGREPRDGGRRIKAMKMQGSLASVPYGHRTRTKEEIADRDTFEQLDLLPEVRSALLDDALKGMINVKPTPIQRLAIPALLGEDIGFFHRGSRRGRSEPQKQEFLLAAETGSGKTLAYLLPSINAMKKAEAADPDILAYREAFEKQKAAMSEPGYHGPREFDPHPTMARPRVIVLVPTAELVDQVGAVAKALSHAVKFKACLFSANVSAKIIHTALYSPRGIDLIVTTPHLLASMADADPNILSRVSHIIVDEADSLFDRSFAPVTVSVLDRALPSSKQLILCSATIPKRLDKYLETEFPNITRITSPNLHAIPRRIQLGVIDVSKDPFRNNKDLACADAIWAIGKESARYEDSTPGVTDIKRIMVFVNEREKTQEVANYLVSKGIDAVALHRDTEEQRQSEMLESFTSKNRTHVDIPDVSPSPNKKTLPNTKVIVATDLASRGIDTLAVRHVILYDVPHTTIDFIHRLGRAGRMGRRGRGVVLVGKHDRRDIVAEVRDSMYMGQALI
ncbi:ATP-dependent RNA helicase mrh-4, mitochondrial [Xylaria sp. CBS 124048]|nr:ATP-dependent RNA helicase mrh-4, mitochondrial [Xylaria sp. CBS 124048]